MNYNTLQNIFRLVVASYQKTTTFVFMKAKTLSKVSEYAKRKKITTQAVYKQIEKGKLKVVKQFGLTLIVE